MGLHALIFSLSYVTAAAIGFVTLSALTHLLLPAEYGVYSTAVNFAFFAGSFLFSWIRFSAGRYESEAVGDIALGFWLRCFLAVIPLALLLITIGYVTGLLSPLAAAGIALLCISQSLFELSQEFNRARAQPRTFTSFNILRSVLNIVFAVPVAYAFENGALIVLTLGASFLIAAVLNLLDTARKSRGGTPRTYSVRPILTYGIGLAGSGLVFSSIGVISRLLVVHLIGIEAAGTYNASLDLSGQIGGIVAQSISAVVSPLIFKSFSQGDMRKVQRDFNRGGELLLAAILPTTAGLILVCEPLIRLLTGEAFHATLIELLPWTVASVAIANFNHYYLHIAFQMTNRPVFQILSGLAQLAILLVASCVLITADGVRGAVQALLFTNLLTMVVTTMLARRAFPIPLPWVSLLKVGSSTLLMVLVVLSLPRFPEAPLVELLIKSVVGGSVFVALAFVLDICGIRRSGLPSLRRR